jgi:nicotinate-nucleotide adenylyltransferase
MTVRNIALFGGSFHPPHLGHVLCATYARVMRHVEEVWVLPAVKHPYAKTLPKYALRRLWCEAAFADLPFVTIRDDEQENPTGRTWDLIDILEVKHPELRFALIGGSDIAADIRNWYRGNELCERIDLIPVPRGGFTQDISLPEISSSAIREADLEDAFLAKALTPRVLKLWQTYRLKHADSAKD